MSSVTESNLGLNYGWAYGESGWNTGMDDNLVKLGFTSRNRVKGILSAPPSTPSNGDAYIVGTSPTGLFSGNFGKVAIWDRTVWLFLTPKNHEVVYNVADGCDYKYDNGWILKQEDELSPYVKVKDFTFSTGYTITDQRQCLLNLADNKYYQWFGALPKVVPAGSTPATSGGIAVGAWIDRTDMTLRSQLSGDDGAVHQSYKLSGVEWSVKRSLQDILDASFVDLTGVSPSNIQTALNYCYSLSNFSIVKLPKSLSLSSGLIIRVDKVQLRGPCALDFTAMEAGVAPSYNYALTLTASTNPPYTQTHESLVDIELVGPNKAVQTCGIRYNSDIENSGVSHINLRNVNIHGFAEAEMYQNHAYIIGHENCDIWGNSRAILHDAGYADYGERISYTNCTIFNNDRVLDANNPNGGIHFINSSLDYNGDFGEVAAGYVTLTDCHVEMGTYTMSFFKANGIGAAIDMNGGWLLCTSVAPHNSDSFAYAAAGASVRLRPTKSNNMQNISNRWGKGEGFIDVEIYNSYFITQNPSITADSNNLLSGGFDVVVDDVFIVADTSPITSRITGTNINISTSTDTYRSAPRSLKVTKTFGDGSPCSFIIAVPIQQHKCIGCELWYKKMDSSYGTVYVNYEYGSGYKIDPNGVPSFAKTSKIGTEILDLSTSEIDWTKLTRGEPLSKSPSWATHFCVHVNMHGLSAGSLYFDDAVIVMG